MLIVVSLLVLLGVLRHASSSFHLCFFRRFHVLQCANIELGESMSSERLSPAISDHADIVAVQRANGLHNQLQPEFAGAAGELCGEDGELWVPSAKSWCDSMPATSVGAAGDVVHEDALSASQSISTIQRRWHLLQHRQRRRGHRIRQRNWIIGLWIVNM